MRDIKYSGNTAYTDNFFGSGKTWLYNGHIHEVPDVVADKLLTNPLFSEVDADPVLAVIESGNTKHVSFGTAKPEVPITSTSPAIGQVLTWDGDEYGNKTPGLLAKYAAQTEDDPEDPIVIGEEYTDLPGATISLGNLPAGALLAVHVQASMATDAGSVTVALSNGTTATQLLASTATTAETRVAAAGSAAGLVQTGTAGGLIIIPINTTGAVTYKLQAKHVGATAPVVTDATLRVLVIGA